MYQPYLIANFATGLDQSLQPWLTPDDSQHQLFDGFVYRGIWEKRQGYSQFATGQVGGSPYCESRMIHTVTVAANEAADGMRTAFTFTVAASTKPLRRGGFRAIDSTAGGIQSQIIQDDGVGGTLAGSDGTITTVLNYTTTLATPQGVTFTAPPAAMHVITLSLDVHQGFPVMGVMNFFDQTNVNNLIVADTNYVNRYNPLTNRLDDISPSTLLTGNNTNFMSWCNYPSPNNLQRLLFVNFKDPVQQYSGTTVTSYPIYTDSLVVTTVASTVVGDGTSGPYTIQLAANLGIAPGSLTVTNTTVPQSVTDNSFGILTGAGTGTVDYLHGTIVVTFSNNVGVGDPINIAYTQMNTPINTALHIFPFKDRLVVVYTIESNIQYGLRIRISGTGAFGDVFVPSLAIGAGIVDVPDATFLSSGDFIRDVLMLFTQDSTWAMKYTQNDVVPFVLDRIDESRGSHAPYGTITYLNKTNAESRRGRILTDGYSVVRIDDKIPDFTFNVVDQQNFKLCFAGSVDDDRDHYLLFPTAGNTKSDQILVTNYEEDNFSLYRLPLSSMGTFVEQIQITWNDLLIYPTWDALAEVYGNWNEFPFSKGSPFSVGGGHRGEITQLNVSEIQDYPVEIRNVTIVDAFNLSVTTDFQEWQEGDIIFLEGMSGLVQANNKQYSISGTPSSNYTFNLVVPDGTAGFANWSAGGTASKVIVFDCTTKKFNPFANSDNKVRCGWVYFYVSTTGTDLTANMNITNATKADPCVLTVPGHGYSNGVQVYVDGVVGMTQLNGIYYYITLDPIDPHNKFSLNNIDSSGFTTYSSGGFTSTPVDASIIVRAITNDNEESIILNNYNPSPFQVNLSSQAASNGIKKWYKLWVNQTARFIQFQVINNQAGAKVEIHAIMPGFAPVGRMI